MLPLFYQDAFAQRYNQNHFLWTELNLVVKTKGRVTFQLDYQFRRQGESESLRSQIQTGAYTNAGEKPRATLVAHPAQQVIRPWIQYQLTDKVRISISPLGWWGTWTPLGGTDYKFRPEFRTTFQLNASHALGRVALTQRYRYEFRFLGKDLPMDGSAGDDYYKGITNPENRQGRFRYMLRANIPLTKPKLDAHTLYANISEEAFVSIGHTVKRERVFDQNRFLLGLGYKFSPALCLETGYLNQLVPKGKQIDINHAVQVVLIIDDFAALLPAKKQTVSSK
jgi:hypothetical protein